MKRFTSENSKLGLSDQTWICSNDANHCPESLIASWAKSAIDQQVGYLEFEPVWYFFAFPVGSIPDETPYAIDGKWSDRGYATSNLIQLGKDLGMGDIDVKDAPTPVPKIVPIKITSKVTAPPVATVAATQQDDPIGAFIFFISRFVSIFTNISVHSQRSG